jgi:hypothetical protein
MLMETLNLKDLTIVCADLLDQNTIDIGSYAGQDEEGEILGDFDKLS